MDLLGNIIGAVFGGLFWLLLSLLPHDWGNSGVAGILLWSIVAGLLPGFLASAIAYGYGNKNTFGAAVIIAVLLFLLALFATMVSAAFSGSAIGRPDEPILLFAFFIQPLSVLLGGKLLSRLTKNRRNPPLD